VQETVREGTGAVDRELELGGRFVLHGVGGELSVREGLLDLAAAAETPHRTADFFDEILFEHGHRDKFALERIVQFVIEVTFVGADEVVSGEETVGDGVLRGDGFAFFGARSAAVFG
jgi:hypothetical protein